MGGDEGSISYLKSHISMLKKSKCMLTESEEIKKRERKFRALADNSPDLIVRIDKKLRYTYVNPSIVRESGIPEKDWIGKRVTDLPLSKELIHERRRIYRKVFETGREQISEFQFESGETARYFHVRTIPEFSAGGKISSLLSVSRDVTEFKRAEENLRRVHRALVTLSSCGRAITHARSEDQLLREICRVIVEHGGYRLAWVGYAELDKNKTIRPVAQWGYEEGYLDKVNVTWRDAERGRGPTGTAFRTGKPFIIRYVATDPEFLPWRDEAVKRGYASVMGIPLSEGKVKFGVLTIYAAEQDAFNKGEQELLGEMAEDLAYGIMSLRARTEREKALLELQRARDELEFRVKERTRELCDANKVLQQEIKERKQAEQKLRGSYQKLQALTSELARVEESERKQIAMELHDRLGQNLAISRLTLESVHEEISAKFKKRLTDAINLIKDSIQDTRLLIRELSPRLFEIGFIPALEALCDQITEKYGLEIKLKRPQKLKLPDEIQSLLFRDIRELIINSVKHSGAKKIDIEIKRRPGFINVRVEDCGKGFDTAIIDPTKGFGLFSIGERFEAQGGKFTINSAPGRGTLAVLELPLK